jgi:MoxR-like ATPase
MTDIATLASLAEADAKLRAAVGRRVIGQATTVDAVLTALFAGGHALLVGAPGTAKTLLVASLCEALGWRFKRIQFTPDLMPADVLGSEVLREDRASGARSLEYVPGPVFANLVLADEINRTPPKTQAALLEAMQERAVTVGGHTRPLPIPFHVLATQNPIEQEGTYPLPEAQLDRFLLAVPVEYPARDEELAIATLDTVHRPAIEPVLGIEAFAELTALVARLPVPETAVAHAVDLCRGTRPHGGDAWVREHIAWGAGPRAAQALIACARARAARAGRAAAEVADVRAVAPLVLAHRLVPSFQAAGAGLDGRAIAARIIETVKP